MIGLNSRRFSGVALSLALYGPRPTSRASWTKRSHVVELSFLFRVGGPARWSPRSARVNRPSLEKPARGAGSTSFLLRDSGHAKRMRSSSKINQAQAHGGNRCLGPQIDSELQKEGLEMRLDRVLGNKECAGDFLVRSSLDEKLEDFEFA